MALMVNTINLLVICAALSSLGSRRAAEVQIAPEIGVGYIYIFLNKNVAKYCYVSHKK